MIMSPRFFCKVMSVDDQRWIYKCVAGALAFSFTFRCLAMSLQFHEYPKILWEYGAINMFGLTVDNEHLRRGRQLFGAGARGAEIEEESHPLHKDSRAVVHACRQRRAPATSSTVTGLSLAFFYTGSGALRCSVAPQMRYCIAVTCIAMRHRTAPSGAVRHGAAAAASE